MLVLMTSISATAQSPSKNYVQTKTFLDAAGTTFLRHIDYYDELGVVAETVEVGVNTSQTPVVTRTEYDTQLKPSCLEAQGDRPLVSNGISANNPKKEQYEQARKKEFGE